MRACAAADRRGAADDPQRQRRDDRPAPDRPAGATKLGVRPEYVSLAEPNAAGAVPARVSQVQDIGTYWLVTSQLAPDLPVRARLGGEQAIPRVGDEVWLKIVSEHTCFYKNEELIA